MSSTVGSPTPMRPNSATVPRASWRSAVAKNVEPTPIATPGSAENGSSIPRSSLGWAKAGSAPPGDKVSWALPRSQLNTSAPAVDTGAGGSAEQRQPTESAQSKGQHLTPALAKPPQTFALPAISSQDRTRQRIVPESLAPACEPNIETLISCRCGHKCFRVPGPWTDPDEHVPRPASALSTQSSAED